VKTPSAASVPTTSTEVICRSLLSFSFVMVTFRVSESPTGTSPKSTASGETLAVLSAVVPAGCIVAEPAIPELRTEKPTSTVKTRALSLLV
jgi:hypothetical protein